MRIFEGCDRGWSVETVPEREENTRVLLEGDSYELTATVALRCLRETHAPSNAPREDRMTAVKTALRIGIYGWADPRVWEPLNKGATVAPFSCIDGGVINEQPH